MKFLFLTLLITTAHPLAELCGAESKPNFIFLITHSICSPGRAGFLTEQHTQTVGVMGNDTPFHEDAVTHATLTREISGWQVHIQKKLLEADPADTEHALVLLKKMLDEIIEVMPAAAVTELRKVPLYFSPAYKAGQSGAEFHPGADWLRENGRDPAMAQCVEFSGVHDFEAEMKRMPNFALHELAHAYHFRFLKDGFDNADLKAAYARAKASGSYDQVERSRGDGSPNTTEKAYAMTDPMEYFAEATEAFFVRNDFYPFTREELKKHDPEMLKLVELLWTQP